MKNFMSGFLNEDWSDRPSGPRVYLGAFGKHPGWNDHFDQGLETESMVAAKQLLYVHGIGNEVEAQTWEKLPEPNRLQEFDHWFVWLRPSELLIGYFCSSRDGKGRSLYPLVVCAHLVDLPLSWAWSTALPCIEDVSARLRAASTEGRVISTLSEALDELRSKLSPTSMRDAAGFIPTTGVASVTKLLSADPLLLYPLYQELTVRFQSFAPGTSLNCDDSHAPRAQCLRLPALNQSVPETINGWLGFLLSELDPASPALAIMPAQGSWVDILFGLPGRGDFFPIRAARTHVPLTTDFSRKPIPILEPLVTQRHGELLQQQLPASSVFNHQPPVRNLQQALLKLSASKSRGKGLFWRLFGASPQRAYPVFCGD